MKEIIIDVNGFIYSAKLTNALANEVPESNWDVQLIPELGTLRKLFLHIVRVRDIYRDGLRIGEIHFPGSLPSKENSLLDELNRSMDELAFEFKQENFNHM
ncbi:hypothetical protein [Salinibacillus xinjiangensis]|uniref:hypothetical protein n=1 Tax=Salinibacillus xinjiangensis TaxID=1229268 RepID=UPI00189183FB|nr:hypothetical protein [Salinibacillus xinjiangensis]